MEFESLAHYKNVLSFNLFVRPGDYNYTLSRWSYFNGYYREFFWQGLQTIEKYCKAALAVNGRSVISDSHDIRDLFSKLQEMSGNAVAPMIIPPNEVGARWFRTSTTENFIARVYAFGQPDTRYNQLSYDASWPDLIKLDWTCFNLRRFTVNLEGVAGDDWPVDRVEEQPGRRYREIVTANPNFQFRGEIRLPPHRTETKKAELRSLIHRYNFAYRRDPEDLLATPDPAMLENSYLYLLSESLERPNRSDILVEGTRWLVDVMRLPKGARRHFLDLVDQKLVP